MDETGCKTDFEKLTIEALPRLLIGADTIVPTLHGPRRYINFDNAASTPTFAPICDAIYEFMRFYSNVHRGTGFKSQLSSWVFEEARDLAAKFVGADLNRQVVIFTKNSTEAINKLTRRIPLKREDIILTTLMEHHSNELPWRQVGRVMHIGLNPDGTISKDDFMSKIAELGDKIKIVGITGASNVTGYITDMDFFARETHKIGAKILIDGAQLVPHRPVDMKPDNPETCIDYLVFSAHKMYAPFGVGVLVGDKKTFEQGDPETVGGGMVDIVTLEEAYWADLPEKEEAGTPDITGVVALGKAIKLFKQIGWKSIIDHESELAAYTIEKLTKIPKVIIYGDTDPSNAHNRLGVVSFNIEGLSHALVASILSYEGAIGVRSGCFCAHTYVKSLLGLTPKEEETLRGQILSRNRSEVPGAVRISFGIYNTQEEIDQLVEMVGKIARGEYHKNYQINYEKGEYSPDGFNYNFEDYFKL